MIDSYQNSIEKGNSYDLNITITKLELNKFTKKNISEKEYNCTMWRDMFGL